MLDALKDVFRHPTIRIATLTMFCLGFTFASTLPYLSIIGTTQLGMSAGEFGALLGAMAVLSTVGALVIGQMSDQARDRKPGLLACIGLGALGYGAFALFPGKPSYVACLLLVTPVSTSAFPQLFAVIRSVTAEMGVARAASINSAVRAVFGGSWVLVPGLVGAWVGYRDNVSDAFAIAASAYALAFLLYLTFGPSGGATGPAENRLAALGQAMRLVASRPIFLRLTALALVLTPHAVIAAILPLIVDAMQGGSTRDIGIMAGITAGCEIPLMLLLGGLNRRFRTFALLAVGGLLHAVYLVALAQAGAVWQVYALTLVNALGAAVVLSLNISYAQELMPDRPGLGSSLVTLSMLISRGLAAGLFALVGGGFSYAEAALVGAAIASCGALGLVLLDRQKGLRH